MPRDEVDDTDMTPAEFRAAAASGHPVRVVTSREDYERQMVSVRSETGVVTYTIGALPVSLNVPTSVDLPAHFERASLPPVRHRAMRWGLGGA